MSEAAIITAIFAAVFVPLLIFTASALLASRPAIENTGAARADDFLLAGREVSQGSFINSSTGYMLQVSTTFYFIFWGYNYGFSNIFFLLTWALGIAFLGVFTKRLLELRLKHTTLPQIIAGEKRRGIQVLAALATILSFAGVFYVEAFFATDLIVSASGAIPIQGGGSATNVWWAIFALITIATAGYSMTGGLRKVVANDVWQLSFAYLGLGLVFAVLLHQTFNRSLTDGGTMTALCLGMFFCIMLCDRKLFDGRIKLIALVSTVTLIIGTAAVSYATSAAPVASVAEIPGPLHQLMEPWGWFTILGFALTNIFWQFADSSVFQRIAALRVSDRKEEAERELNKTLRSLAIVSPLTWSLGIVLGMFIKTAGIGVGVPGSEYAALVDFLRGGALSGNWVDFVALLALVVGLVAIMMSTVDVAIIAASQSFFTDVTGPDKFKAWHATGFGALLLLMAILLAFVHTQLSQSSVLTVMAGAYSAVLFLAPLGLAALARRNLPGGFGVAAILAGFVGAAVGTFGPIQSLPSNVQLVLPIYCSLLPSLLIVGLGLIIGRRGAVQ